MTGHNVARPSAEWELMMQDLELIHDLSGGTSAMRRAGLKWLPREQSESWDSWHARLNRSVLYNGLARTIQAMTGHGLFGDILIEGMDQRLKALTQNLDGRGMSIQRLASQLLQLLLRDGVAHLLIDQNEDGGRPYIVLLEAAQVIGQLREKNNQTIQQVRIRETVSRQQDRFSAKPVEQIRVLEKGQFEIWQEQENNNWQVVQDGQMDLDEIPIVTATVGVPMHGVITPPLIDLAWLNLAHWQSASDQRHILHIARVPILFARALGGHEGPLEIGPNRLIIADDPSADLKFIEHSGAAIQAGRQDLVDLEDKMAVMGLELLTPRATHPTATGRAIDQAHDRAMLHTALQSLNDSLMMMMGVMASWLDLPETAIGQIHFPQQPPGMEEKTKEAELLLKARQSGEIDKESFLEEIERRGILLKHK